MADHPALWRFIYVLPNLLAAFGMLLVALLSWRFRARRGGWALWMFAMGAAAWAFTEGISFLATSPATIVLLWKLGFFGVAMAPLAMNAFCLDYIGYGHWLTRRRLGLLAVLPASVLVAAWSNEWHGWIWPLIEVDPRMPFLMLQADDGPLLWVYFSYVALLSLSTIAFLLWRRAQLPPLQRRQLGAMVLALGVPLLVAALYMVQLVPVPNMDLTPLAFNVSGFVLLRGFWRERLFELAPVSAHEIYRHLEDAVLVIDEQDRILDCNQAAQRMLAPSAGCIGQRLEVLLPAARVLLSDSAAGFRSEIEQAGRWYDVQMTRLQAMDRRMHGRMLVWRDISERKQLESDLLRLARTDALTGLSNRRYFQERGEEEVLRARRYGRPLSLVMLDVDYFKCVNDAHGHEAGDRVLQALAVLLQDTLRATDHIGRLGGEEFALLLPEIDAGEASEIGQRLMQNVAAMQVPLDDGQVIIITISAGVAALTMADDGFNGLLRRSDDALYRAKHAGRNQLVQY